MHKNDFLIFFLHNVDIAVHRCLYLCGNSL